MREKKEGIGIVAMCVLLVLFVGFSIYCTCKLVDCDGETDAFLYNKAMKINPSCANWCAELGFIDGEDEQARACFKRVIERGYCRK